MIRLMSLAAGLVAASVTNAHLHLELPGLLALCAGVSVGSWLVFGFFEIVLDDQS